MTFDAKWPHHISFDHPNNFINCDIVPNIINHIVGKDGCLKIDAQTTPSTYLWTSLAQN